MATAIRFAVLAAVLMAIPAVGQAEVYQCIAQDGTRTFSDQPCPNPMKSPYECEPVPGVARTFDSSACRDVLGEEGRSPQRELIVSQPRSAAIAATPRPVAQPHIGDQIVASLVGQFMNMLGQLWWLVALLLLLALAGIPVIKGWLGEQLVRIALAFGLPKSDYQVFYDVTVRGSDGTTQIDHLVVSRFGVFVIETKSMKGWIFGQAQDAQWTQQNFRHKSQFQNPLRQNHRHISVLKEILQLPEEHFRGLVVFVGSAEFKRGRPAGVYGLLSLIPAIKRGNAELMPQWSAVDIARRIDTVRLARGRATNRAHIDDLARRHGR